MSNSFLFIIPLTPSSHLTNIREELQENCLKALKNQKYKNWKALLIGKDFPCKVKDDRFIHLPIEDIKEIKVQHATKYLKDNQLKFDYIIRLDDDDLISDSILSLHQNTKADIIVDIEHWYIDWTSKRVSKDFKPWFPNTCIHKSENALTTSGDLAQSYMRKVNTHVSLIENNHSNFHNFYKGKKIIFTPSNAPIYLRVLNPDSITSNSDNNYTEYLKNYGNWNSKTPNGFSNLKTQNIGKSKFNLKKYLYSQISQFKFKLLLKK